MQAANEPQSTQETPDLETTRDHLQLIGIFYIIFGLLAVPVLFVIPFLSGIIDHLVQSAPDQATADLVEKLAGVSVAGIIALTILHILVLIYVGVCFRKQQHHTLCIVAAAFCCLSFPLGTILGVISLIVLLKPEAKQLYGVQ